MAHIREKYGNEGPKNEFGTFLRGPRTVLWMVEEHGHNPNVCAHCGRAFVPFDKVAYKDAPPTTYDSTKIKYDSTDHMIVDWDTDKYPLGKSSREVHHKNGNPSDTRIENCEILCSMCHSQTKDYKGRNKY